MHYQIISNYERTLYGFEFWIGSKKLYESELNWLSRESVELIAIGILNGFKLAKVI